MNGKLLGLNKWAWLGVAALGVVIFLYVRHRNADAANVGNPQFMDANATDTASLGGTPASVDNGSIYSPDNAALIGDLISLLEQSQMQYGEDMANLLGSGIVAPRGGGATGTGSTGSSGASTSGTASTQPGDTGASSTDGSGIVFPTSSDSTQSGSTVTYSPSAGAPNDPGFGFTFLSPPDYMAAATGDVYALAQKGYVLPTTEISSSPLKPPGQAVAT